MKEEQIANIAKVSQYIRNGILSGSWPVGAQIPSENTMCRELNVNRSVVRSAVKQYTSLNILKSVHGKGTFVTSNAEILVGSGHVLERFRNQLLPLMEYRLMLEPNLCFKASQKITDGIISELENISNEMNLHSDDALKFVSLDCSFHMLIASTAGNPIAVESLRSIFKDNFRYLVEMHDALGSYNGHYYHTKILEALRDRNASRSKLAMYNHLNKSSSELLLLLDQQQ